MPTDVFLGGLASLVLVAIIIVTLTAGKRTTPSGREQQNTNKGPNTRRKKSAR